MSARPWNTPVPESALKHSSKNPWVPEYQLWHTQQQKALYLPVPECQDYSTQLKTAECLSASTETLPWNLWVPECQHRKTQVPARKHSSASTETLKCKHRNIQVPALQRNPQSLWAHNHIIVAQPFIKIKQKPLFTSKSVTRSAVYPTYARYVVHPWIPDRSFRFAQTLKCLQCLALKGAITDTPCNAAKPSRHPFTIPTIIARSLRNAPEPLQYLLTYINHIGTASLRIVLRDLVAMHAKQKQKQKQNYNCKYKYKYRPICKCKYKCKCKYIFKFK